MKKNKNHSKPSSIPAIIDLFDDSITVETFLNAIPKAIMVLDVHQKIIRVNNSFEVLTGFIGKEIVNLPCYHVMRSSVCIKNCPVREKDNLEKAPCSLSNNLINLDRVLMPIQTNISALKDTQGKISGYLETVEKIEIEQEFNDLTHQSINVGGMIGKSPQIEKVFRLLPILAQSESSILITGETGTGKDKMAEFIHQNSNRAKGPFIKVNCGALPATLLESELFGHEKGAFTGAASQKPGRIKLAHNGTLYLTEIGDLPLPLQVKLLTFLDDKVIFPLGGTKGIHVDVRIVAATHRHLEQMVSLGEFREDLLYRLNVARVHIPSLKEREGDIKLLLIYFLNNLTQRFQKKIKDYSAEAMKILMSYPYPGNIRELLNIVEYSVTICQGSQVLPSHLPEYLTARVADGMELQINQSPSDYTVSSNPEMETNTNKTWSSVEKEMILKTLLEVKGNRSNAAKLLGWGRSTLWRKMKQYQIV